MARGNNKMAIFLDELDYSQFQRFLLQMIERFEVDSWLVCAMPNHFHLVFRTRQPNLSLAMRFLNGEFARWWNRRHGHVGHVFQGRFKAQVVEHGIYLLRLVRYVLMNPVRAHLVTHPSQWRWSSFPALVDEAPGGLVDTQSLVDAIDPDHDPSTRLRLLDFVAGAADVEMGQWVRSDRRVLGSDTFAAQFKQRARRASLEVPARERRTGTPALVRLLADELSANGGMTAGIRAAFSEGYPISEIASTAGIAERSVRRMLNLPVSRPGPGRSRNVDLAPV